MTQPRPQNRRLGYARVSSFGQTLDAQLEQLRGAACTRIYREKVTGAHNDRRELLKMLKGIEPGDVVTVTRIDRLRAAPSTSWPLSSRSWTPRRSFDHWPSHGLTPTPAPGA